jgi:hypothetical protein
MRAREHRSTDLLDKAVNGVSLPSSNQMQSSVQPPDLASHKKENSEAQGDQAKGPQIHTYGLRLAHHGHFGDYARDVSHQPGERFNVDGRRVAVNVFVLCVRIGGTRRGRRRRRA